MDWKIKERQIQNYFENKKKKKFSEIEKRESKKTKDKIYKDKVKWDKKIESQKKKKIELEKRKFKWLKPKPKKKTKKTLENKLDKLWSDAVKMRAKYQCEYSLNKWIPVDPNKMLNSHHVFGRDNKRLRWDLRNWVCLMVYYHTFSKEFSAHKTPLAFLKWFQEYRKDDFRYLEIENAKWTKKWALEDLENKKRELEDYIKKNKWFL